MVGAIGSNPVASDITYIKPHEGWLAATLVNENYRYNTTPKDF